MCVCVCVCVKNSYVLYSDKFLALGVTAVQHFDIYDCHLFHKFHRFYHS